MRRLFWVALLLVGCSEEPEVLEGTLLDCRTDLVEFETCGGDPTGDWYVTDACLAVPNPPNPFPECEEITFEFSSSPVGNIRLDADGSQSAQLTIRTRVRFKLPMSCLEDINGSPEVCADIPVPEGLNPCVERFDGCLCAATSTMELSREGTWTTDGDRLLLDEGGGGTEFGFCAEGRFLDLVGRGIFPLGNVEVITRIRLLAPQ